MTTMPWRYYELNCDHNNNSRFVKILTWVRLAAKHIWNGISLSQTFKFILLEMYDYSLSHSHSRFAGVRDLTNLRLVSTGAKKFIDMSDSIWKHQFLMRFPNRNNTISNEMSWRAEFIEAWTEENSNHWIELGSRKNTLTNNNLTAIHNEGTYYFPIRARFGISDTAQR
jgi:hypothetical protein